MRTNMEYLVIESCSPWIKTMPSSHPANRFERHPLLAICCIFAFFFGCLLALDFGLSTLFPADPLANLLVARAPLGHFNRENISFTFGRKFLEEFRVASKFNNCGFRDDRDLTPELRLGKKLIFAVGDSTTAGLEVPLAQSFPRVMEQAMGGGYLVMNVGVRGYDTQQALILYRAVLRQFKPDLLLYTICSNDFDENINPDAYPDLRGMFGKGIILKDGTSSYLPPGFTTRQRLVARVKTYLASHFTFTRTIVGSMSRLLGASRPVDNVSLPRPASSRTAMMTMKRLLQQMEAETARDGVKLVISWSPGIAQHARHSDAILQSGQYQDYRQIAAFVQQELPDAVFIKTLDHFIGQYQNSPALPDFTFKRDPHSNAFGNRALGAYVASELMNISSGDK